MNVRRRREPAPARDPADRETLRRAAESTYRCPSEAGPWLSHDRDPVRHRPGPDNVHRQLFGAERSTFDPAAVHLLPVDDDQQDLSRFWTGWIGDRSAGLRHRPAGRPRGGDVNP